MKNIIWPIVVLIIAISLIAEYRYVLIVDSPVVARLDRLTGEAWIVNSGVWRKIQIETQMQNQPVVVESKKAAKAK